MRVVEPVPHLDAALGALARLDLDATRAETIRDRAQRVLARHRTPAGRVRSALSATYEGLLEPALVSALAAGYLLWALANATSLLGWRP